MPHSKNIKFFYFEQQKNVVWKKYLKNHGFERIFRFFEEKSIRN